MENNRRSGYWIRVVRWIALMCLALVITVRRSRPERPNGGGSDDATNMLPQRAVQRKGVTAAVYAALIATICLMVVGLSVIGLDLPQSLTSSLLLGVAVALAAIGVVIWSSESSAEGSRSNLGAALLGSAVVTFTVFGFQLADARQQAALEQNYREASLTLQSVSNRIDQQAITAQRQAIKLQAQAIKVQQALAKRETSLAQRQIAAAQRGAAPTSLQHLQLTLALKDDLTGIDLRGMDLSGYYLGNKTLVNANLSDADLSRANLQGANLTGANLRGAKLRASIADASTQWPRGFDARRAGVILR
jgi:uncharacterized protein YjbI with pentapeptide repeats